MDFKSEHFQTNYWVNVVDPKLVTLTPILLRCHMEQASKSNEYSRSKKRCLKRVRLDAGGVCYKANFSIFGLSYVAALRIAKAKKLHIIPKTLVKPCLPDCVKLVLDAELTTN